MPDRGRTGCLVSRALSFDLHQVLRSLSGMQGIPMVPATMGQVADHRPYGADMEAAHDGLCALARRSCRARYAAQRAHHQPPREPGQRIPQHCRDGVKHHGAVLLAVIVPVWYCS